MATARYLKTMISVLFILITMCLAEVFISPKPGTLIGGAEVLLEAIALYCLLKRCSAVGTHIRLTIILVLFFACLIIADISYIFSFYVFQGLAIVAAYLAVFVAFVTFLGARDIFWTLLSIGMLTLGLGDWAMRIETILDYAPHFGFYEYYWAAGVGFLAITVMGQKDSFRPLEIFSFNSLLNTYKLGALLTVLLFVILIFTSGAPILSLKLVILSFIVCVIVAGLIS